MELIANTRAVNEFRHAVFKAVDNEISNTLLHKIQQLIGVWPGNIDFKPAKEAFSISETGVYSVPYEVNGGHVFTFSAFMFLGEIRLGLFIKNEIFYNHVKSKAPKFIHNHQPLLNKTGDNFAVDWIFREQWVGKTDLMMRMIKEKNVNEIGGIADAIAKQSTHLIISAITAIVLEEASKTDFKKLDL